MELGNQTLWMPSASCWVSKRGTCEAIDCRWEMGGSWRSWTWVSSHQKVRNMTLRKVTYQWTIHDFWWYLSGKMELFHCYISFRELSWMIGHDSFFQFFVFFVEKKWPKLWDWACTKDKVTISWVVPLPSDSHEGLKVFSGLPMRKME